MREKKTTREHFIPNSKSGEIYTNPYANVDPAQLDRYEFRFYTSKELEDSEKIEEDELELA
jgi:hypothetical protein